MKKPPVQSSPLSALGLAAAALKKAFPKVDMVAAISEDDFTESRPHYSTGSIVLDYLIGGRTNKFGIRPCPGVPKGGIVNLYGQESSGKTTFALMVAAQVCAAGGTVAYVDWENAIDVQYSKSIGVPVDDPNKFMLIQPGSLEQGISAIHVMAKSGISLIVIDSVGAAIPEANLAATLAEKGDQGRIGLNAQRWSKYLPELKSIIVSSGSCVIGISQLRQKMSMGQSHGGETTQAQGGDAWKFYSDLRISLKKFQQEKGKLYNAVTHAMEDAVVGQITRVKIDKCKVSASQGKSADIYIKFGNGIDDRRSVYEIAMVHGIVKKVSSWISYESNSGNSIKTNGLDKFREQVEATSGLYEELRNKVIIAMSADQTKESSVIFQEDDTDPLADLGSILSDGNQQTEEMS